MQCDFISIKRTVDQRLRVYYISLIIMSMINFRKKKTRTHTDPLYSWLPAEVNSIITPLLPLYPIHQDYIIVYDRKTREHSTWSSSSISRTHRKMIIPYVDIVLCTYYMYTHWVHVRDDYSHSPGAREALCETIVMTRRDQTSWPSSKFTSVTVTSLIRERNGSVEGSVGGKGKATSEVDTLDYIGRLRSNVGRFFWIKIGLCERHVCMYYIYVFEANWQIVEEKIKKKKLYYSRAIIIDFYISILSFSLPVSLLFIQ